MKLVGNRRLVSLLAGAPLPPASLFSGPEGVGKKTLAVALAAHANCSQADEDGACGRCSSCRKVAAGQHPDVTLIDRPWLERFAKARKRTYNAQVIPIDVARELVREAQFRPYEGRLRIFVVDDAEKLNEPAANALLKTLEEPPETTRFVLVSAYRDQLLETVRSRCQQFLFQPLARSEIQAFLEAREDGEAEVKAALAGGSVGRALSLDLDEERRDRQAMAAILARWLSNRSFAELFRACEGKDLRKDLKNRERVLRLLAVLRSLAQDLYFLQTAQPDRVANLECLEQLEPAAGQCTLDWLRQFLYHVDEAEEDVRGYVHPLMTFEAIWLKSLEHAGDRPGQV